MAQPARGDNFAAAFDDPTLFACPDDEDSLDLGVVTTEQHVKQQEATTLTMADLCAGGDLPGAAIPDGGSSFGRESFRPQEPLSMTGTKVDPSLRTLLSAAHEKLLSGDGGGKPIGGLIVANVAFDGGNLFEDLPVGVEVTQAGGQP